MMIAPLVVLLRPGALAWAAATTTSLFSLVIAIALTQSALHGQSLNYEVGSWPAPFGIALAVDHFSAILLLIVTSTSLLALLAGRESLNRDIEHERQPLFYAAWLLVLAGLTGILVSADAFNIFVFMEISSLASYVLIAGGPDRRALPAVFKYLIMGTIGATFYLIGIGLIYLMTGTLNLADMELRIYEVADRRPILVAAGFITVGLALKAAVFPLHVWQPNTYRFAPNIVTVFLAACATKVSIYVLIRLDFFVFQPNLIEHDVQFAYFLMPLAILGILITSGVALFEKNLKRLLAYSSVAQIGYILLGISLISLPGLTAGIVHMFNHALAKGALFLAVACLAMRLPGLQLDELRGIGHRMPWTMGAFVVAGLSLIGIPGTAGFISKWLLISAAIDTGPAGVALIIIILIGSLMTLAYVWRIVEIAYFTDANDNVIPLAEAPLPLLGITWIVALMNLYFGLSPTLPLELASNAAETLLGHVP